MATKKETPDEPTEQPEATPAEPEAPAFTFRPVNKAVEPEEPEETK